MPRLGFAALCAAVIASLVGCGSGKPEPIGTTGAKVKGRLLENGQPIRVRAGEDIVINFSPPNPADVTSTRGSSGVDAKDGSFAFFGTNSAAGLLSAGKYKVTVSSVTASGDDRFAARLSFGTSTLEAVVGAEPEQSFIVDIGRKTVTKQ